jgi:hypothetical protein
MRNFLTRERIESVRPRCYQYPMVDSSGSRVTKAVCIASYSFRRIVQYFRQRNQYTVGLPRCFCPFTKVAYKTSTGTHLPAVYSPHWYSGLAKMATENGDWIVTHGEAKSLAPNKLFISSFINENSGSFGASQG